MTPNLINLNLEEFLISKINLNELGPLLNNLTMLSLRIVYDVEVCLFY